MAGPERGRVTTLQRPRHAPDYVVLVAVVALTAIGILMVYSCSGVQAYAGQRPTRSRWSGRRSCGAAWASSP